MVEKRIHFVCRSNTYRGRLAEAYAKSLKLPGYVFTSSGVEIDSEPHLILSPYARDVARSYKLTPWLSKRKTQTTSTLLAKQDLIVFLSKDVYDTAVAELQFDARKAVVWDIHDLSKRRLRLKLKPTDDAAIAKIIKQITRQIARRIEQFVESCESDRWTDMFDANNKPLGYKLPVSWANMRSGVWRRGVHAVVTTANRRFVLQRQPVNSIFASNILDITLGDGVDCGETPRQAIMRVIKQELGVNIRPEQITFLKLEKVMRYSPYYQKEVHAFMYAYHVALTSSDPIFIPGSDADRDIRLLRLGQVRRLLRYRVLNSLDSLNYSHKYYADVVKRAKIYLK